MRETRTLLLVDSSASSLFFWGMLLKRLEYRVVTARSSDEGLLALEEGPPSAVLVNWDLQGTGGAAFAGKIKDSPRWADIPVFLLSERDERQVRDECRRLGCEGPFTRNGEPDDLYRAIQKATETAPRHHIRLPTALKVVIGDGTVAGGAVRTEHATALSEGGLFVRTRYPQPRNALTPVRIDLNGMEVRARAVVLYSSLQAEGAAAEQGMGMKFVEISEQDRGLIRRFIKDQITGNLRS